MKKYRFKNVYKLYNDFMSKTFTKEEVASHKTAKDCWIIIDNKVYDVTKFLNEHPGGKKVLTRVGGKNATEQFHQLHKSSVLEKVGSEFCIGTIKN